MISPRSFLCVPLHCVCGMSIFHFSAFAEAVSSPRIVAARLESVTSRCGATHCGANCGSAARKLARTEGSCSCNCAARSTMAAIASHERCHWMADISMIGVVGLTPL